ncbi:hypothetical protein ACFL7M_13050 [Thermodesulfobacteriota bacterium]
MKIKSRDIAPIVLAFFVIGITGTIFLNYWNTEQTRKPAKYTSGKFKGLYNPSDIRGSFSFAEINKAFNVPVEDLAKAFGFKDAPNPETLKAQTIERAYGGVVEGGEVGTDSIRMFVAYYLNIPFTASEEGTRIPRPAVSILKSRGLTEEQVKSLEGITVHLPILKQETVAEHAADDVFRIKGKTTFYELLGLGVTREEIEEILGMPMGRSGETIRDFIADKEGMEFGEYKSKFEALIKAKK